VADSLALLWVYWPTAARFNPRLAAGDGEGKGFPLPLCICIFCRYL